MKFKSCIVLRIMVGKEREMVTADFESSRAAQELEYRRTVGIDVWVDPGSEIDELAYELAGAARAAGARLAGFERPGGAAALWPVPVAATTNRARARILLPRDDRHLRDVTDSLAAEVLEAVADVSRWSLVHRLEQYDGIDTFRPIGLH
jgi:hypothetical protein